MTAQDYITSILQTLAGPVKPESIGKMSVEDATLAKVLSKKFRKVRADDLAIATAKEAIQYAVARNEPVKFSLLFGGNKLWRFDEAPEIDWAEFFAVVYYMRWMKTIASVYKPGAAFIFYSQDISVERLNNVPKTETEKYTKTFIEMLDWLKSYMPETVTVSYRRHADDVGGQAGYDREIEAAKAIVLAENSGELPVLSDAQRVATELNVRLRPGQTDDPKWRERVELEHQAIFRTVSLNRFFQEPGKIPISPTPFPGLIITGSTKKSLAKFWAGVGALEKSGDTFSPIVLTPKQLETADFVWEKVEIDGLKGKNFNKIRITQ